MSARHRFPGNDAGESTILTFDTSSDVSFEDDNKYRKKEGISSWSFPKPTNFTKQLSSFTASAINNINQTITANSQPPPQQSSFQLGSSEFEVSADHLFFNRPETQEIVVMASRDRTNEFANAIRSMQGRNIQRAVNIRDPRKAKQMQSYSEFMGVAKLVGRNIASTYTKLEKLTLRKLRWSCIGELRHLLQNMDKSICRDKF